MKTAPLIAASGLVLALAGGIAAFTRDQWMPKPAATALVTAPVTPDLPKITDAKKPEARIVSAMPAKPAAVKLVEAPVAARPEFDTVRVEKSGEAIIAGSAAPGSNVQVKLDGATIGKAIANAEGAFVVIPEKPLPAGSGALSIEETKPSGEIVASAQTIAVAVPDAAKPAEPVVALVAPGAPIKIIQTPARPAKAKDLTLDTIDYGDAGDIRFKGTAKAESPVRLYVNNAPIAALLADARGNWSFEGQGKVAPGTHALRIDQLDAKGAVARRIEMPFTREAPEIVIAAKVADLPPPIDAPARPRDGRVIIQPGNNLWKLSRVIYGRGRQYTLIYDANKEGIKDPRLIYPGQIFSIPDALPPETIDPARKEPLTIDEGGAALQ